MAENLIEVSNPEHWQLLYNESLAAGRINELQYYPLQPVDLPVLIESPFLIAGAENINAKPWWFLGYRLYQIIETGVAPVQTVGSAVRVPINRPSLIKMPLLAAQYSLRVEIPPWFDRMKISIFEYIGPISDTTEAMIGESTDLIRVDLLRIETKINNLS